MRTLTTGLIIAGAALVAACGGGAANNTANATDGNVVTNEPAMAPMNEGMPADNNAMAAPAAPAPDANAAAPAANATNGM
jgi:hypothetical protein